MSTEIPDTLVDQPLDSLEEEHAVQPPSEDSVDEELRNEEEIDETSDEREIGHDDYHDVIDEETSTEELSDDVTEAPSDVATLVDSVQVSLAFEVGKSETSVGQLQTLMPGYTFELSTSIESPIVIKVFDQVIGRGQLMQIGDHLGVRVVEIFSHGNR